MAKREFTPEQKIRNKATSRKWYLANTDKAKESNRKWQAENPGKNLEYKRKSRGLPKPTRSCPEKCELCGKPPSKKALHLDHCHKTGKFRGWLCFRCNYGLGIFGDCKDGVMKILTYLELSG